jgi:hypothetical protein
MDKYIAQGERNPVITLVSILFGVHQLQNIECRDLKEGEPVIAEDDKKRLTRIFEYGMTRLPTKLKVYVRIQLELMDDLDGYSLSQGGPDALLSALLRCMDQQTGT